MLRRGPVWVSRPCGHLASAEGSGCPYPKKSTPRVVYGGAFRSLTGVNCGRVRTTCWLLVAALWCSDEPNSVMLRIRYRFDTVTWLKPKSPLSIIVVTRSSAIADKPLGACARLCSMLCCQELPSSEWLRFIRRISTFAYRCPIWHPQ